MAHKSQQAIDFYSSHPISLDLVLARLMRERGHLANLEPSDLWPHDQDHFGGLSANDASRNAQGLGRGPGWPTSAPDWAARPDIMRMSTAPRSPRSN
jgi:hypothetical protein